MADKAKADTKQSEESTEVAEEATEESEGTTASGSNLDKMMSIERLRRYLAEKLGFHGVEETPKLKVLDDLSLDGVVNYIKNKNVKKIITLAGAGISTSAGIPDFRSKGTGLYHNLQKYNLPHPQAIFELDFFHENPKPFFVLAKELYPGSFKPTVCHYFIKMLLDKGMLLRHYTQNIDTLERVVGIPEDKIVEAHGTFYTGHCLKCRREYKLEWMKERIFRDEIPSCEKCEGVVKPDIVFFGEQLPSKFHKCITKDFPECQLLIVLGSSLVVQPFASLVERVPDDCPRLLINREKVGENSNLLTMLGMGGMDFDSENNTRDVAWLGDCDDGCSLLAEKLGFGDELKKLVETEHKRIDKEKEKDQKKEDSTSKKSEHKRIDKQNAKDKKNEGGTSKISQDEKHEDNDTSKQCQDEKHAKNEPVETRDDKSKI